MTEKSDGNGAREALTDALESALNLRDAEDVADLVLVILGVAGYVIKPIVEH